MIYTSGSYAGALLVILVHAQRPMLRVPYHCFVVDVPADLEIAVIAPDEVPGWEAADYAASRKAGDAWLDAGQSALVRVPAVTGYPFEFNVLINPRHADVARLRLDGPYPVVWARRLLDGP